MMKCIQILTQLIFWGGSNFIISEMIVVKLDGGEEENMKEERSWETEFINGIDLKWCHFVKLLM